MGFTPARLKFNVEKATPTTLEPKNLKAQLNSIGFTCEHTSEPALAQYINEGLGKVTKGSSYLIAILSPKESVEARAKYLSAVGGGINGPNDIAYADHPIKLQTYDGGIEEYYLERVNGSYRLPNAANIPSLMASGNKADWDQTYLMFEKLCIIMAEKNFDKLRAEDYDDFAKRSVYDNPTQKINKTDVDTIKEVLGGLVVQVSARVLNGLTLSDVLPLLVSRFAYADTSASAFGIVDRMITVWACNPRPDGSVDALGAVNSNWIINGNNVPGDKKTNAIHITNFTTKTRAVIYSDQDFINRDYLHVKWK
jgi:hypothetical protein